MLEKALRDARELIRARDSELERAKAEIAKTRGARHVVVYTEEDTETRVLEITKDKGVHAVFDNVGKDMYVTRLSTSWDSSH